MAPHDLRREQDGNITGKMEKSIECEKKNGLWTIYFLCLGNSIKNINKSWEFFLQII